MIIGPIQKPFFHSFQNPLLKLPLVSTLLPTTIILNGTTVTAKAVYQGDDASVTDWLANIGVDLGIGGTGHVVSEDTFFSQTRLVAEGAGTGYWRHAGGEMDIGTGDFVIELVIKGGTNNKYYFANFDTIGWTIYQLSADNIYFYHSDGTAVNIGAASSLTNGTWGHIVVIGDRSGSTRIYVNGAVSATGSSRPGSLADGAGLGILCNGTGTTISDGKVAWAAIWEGTPTWLDTHAQDAWVSARYAML